MRMKRNCEIAHLLPEKKDYKVYFGLGLYILVPTRGNKRWRMKYRFKGREKTLSFGTWPMVLEKEAKLLRAKARKLLYKGIDPGTVKRRDQYVLVRKDSRRDVMEDLESREKAFKEVIRECIEKLQKLLKELKE